MANLFSNGNETERKELFPQNKNDPAIATEPATHPKVQEHEEKVGRRFKGDFQLGQDKPQAPQLSASEVEREKQERYPARKAVAQVGSFIAEGGIQKTASSAGRTAFNIGGRVFAGIKAVGRQAMVMGATGVRTARKVIPKQPPRAWTGHFEAYRTKRGISRREVPQTTPPAPAINPSIFGGAFGGGGMGQKPAVPRIFSGGMSARPSRQGGIYGGGKAVPKIFGFRQPVKRRKSIYGF